MQRVTAATVLLTLWCAGCATVAKAPMDTRRVEAQEALEQGKQLQGAGKYAEAVPLMERALALRREALGPEHVEVAEVLNELGDLAWSQGQYTQAEPLYQQAQALWEAALGPRHPKVATALNNLATLSLNQGQHARARELAERALAILEAAGSSHPEAANSLSTLAILHRVQGQFAKAEQMYKRALDIREKALGPGHLDVAHSLNNLAFLYQTLGQLAQAEPLHERALAIREAALGKAHPDVALSLNNLAVLYHAQGRYTRAAEQLERALKIQEAMLGLDHPLSIRSRGNLAQIYYAQGQYMRAEPLMEQVIDAQKKRLGPTHVDIAPLLNNLAVLYQAQGQYTRALLLFQQALDIRQAALGPHHPDVAFSLSNLAALYQRQGRPAEAEPLYQQALAIHEKASGPGHPDVALSLHNLAFLRRHQGQYSQAELLQERALAIYEKALGPDHPDVARALNNLATIHYAQGRYVQAEPLYQEALRGWKATLGPGHPEVSNARINIALLRLAQRRLSEALPLFEQSFSHSESHLRTQALVLSEERLASFLEVLHTDEQRLYALLRAHLEDAHVRHLALATALLRKGRSVEELAALSRTLSRSLGAEDRDAFDQLRALRTLVASQSLAGPGKLAPEVHQQRLEELADQADAIETRLARSSAPLRAFKELPPPDQIVGSVAGALPSHGALVEFIAYDDSPLVPKPGTPPTQVPREPRYLALVLSAEGRTGAVDLGPAAPIDHAVLRLRELLSRRATAYQPAAQELYRLVFRPLLPLLGNTRHLFLSPDGQLSLIPFDALHDGKAFLADRFDVSYLTSGKDLLPRPAGSASAHSVVVLADPDFGAQPAGLSTAAPPVERSPSLKQFFSTLRQNIADQPWLQLPGTRQEAEAIQRLLPQARLLLGSAATKEALLQLKAPGLLHVATHGFFLEDAATPQGTRGTAEGVSNLPPLAPPADPLLRSGLVLAGAQASNGSPRREDSLVTALELSGMDLWGTQLVVLSACDTGRGDVRPGQGVYGLRRALGVAGAETVVMSLWKVNDETTRYLMEAYYRHLLAGQGRAQALREAMRALRKKEPHPYHWASFIAVGQDTPLRGLTPDAASQVAQPLATLP